MISYNHYKGIQLPNAAGLSGSKNVGSLVETHSSLVRLKTTSLNSISLVMNGFPLVTQHFLLPDACGVGQFYNIIKNMHESDIANKKYLPL